LYLFEKKTYLTALEAFKVTDNLKDIDLALIVFPTRSIFVNPEGTSTLGNIYTSVAVMLIA